MIEIIIKILLVLVAVYCVWFFTGGVERGEQRAAEGRSSLFIEVDDNNDEPLFDFSTTPLEDISQSNN